MIDDLKHHLWHYLFLVLIIVAGGAGFLRSSDNLVRFRIGVLVSLAYIFWGILHHLLENNLNLKIVVEYSLIGLLSAIILGGALL